MVWVFIVSVLLVLLVSFTYISILFQTKHITAASQTWLAEMPIIWTEVKRVKFSGDKSKISWALFKPESWKPGFGFYFCKTIRNLKTTSSQHVHECAGLSKLLFTWLAREEDAECHVRSLMCHSSEARVTNSSAGSFQLGWLI